MGINTETAPERGEAATVRAPAFTTPRLSALEVFRGSDGAITKAFYAQLESRGPAGLVALNLFRAQKCSSRAKKYRGGIRGVGSFKSMAYERKNWSLEQLCLTLRKHGAELGIRWGWKADPAQMFHSRVLYVDLPQGQVSFHAAARGDGPDYPGDWDRQHVSAERIIAFCDQVVREGDAPSVSELSEPTGKES